MAIQQGEMGVRCGKVSLVSAGVAPLSVSVHHRLRLLAFPMRTGGGCRTVDREISRFPRKERLHMPGSLTTPGRPGARADAPRCVAFHHLHGVGTQNRKLSRLNGWPMRSPVNASPRPSRATAHNSGPMRIGRVGSRRGPTSNDLDVSSIPPIIPYGGFSPIRLEGWHVRRGLPKPSPD